MKTNVQDGQHREDLVLHNRLEQQWLRRFANITEVNTNNFIMSRKSETLSDFSSDSQTIRGPTMHAATVVSSVSY